MIRFFASGDLQFFVFLVLNTFSIDNIVLFFVIILIGTLKLLVLLVFKNGWF